MKKVTIIGAGIGGLTTAIALRLKGFEVEVFENTAAFSEAGSGISLSINAMQVYQRLGVYQDVLKGGNHIRRMSVRSKKLGLSASSNLQQFEDKYKVKAVAIHRATLHQILLSHLGDTPVHLNKKLKSLSQSGEKVTLQFEDGTQHIADLVIGADGIHSVTRNFVTQTAKLRDAQQVCWRGISTAKIDQSFHDEINEIWGKGKRFGFVPLNNDQLYWFGLIDKKKYTDSINLQEIFSSFHPLVNQIVEETPEERILCNEIWDLEPQEKWYEGNVCLLGDACHATTPNMGQGAVQAIESAMALSICLAEESTPQQAFSRYVTIRKVKTHRVTNTSWKIGKIAQTNNSLMVSLRNLLVKLTPSSIMNRTNARLFELNY